MSEDFVRWIFEVAGPFGLLGASVLLYARQQTIERREADKRADEAVRAHMEDMKVHSAQLMENTMTLKAALDALRGQS